MSLIFGPCSSGLPTNPALSANVSGIVFYGKREIGLVTHPDVACVCQRFLSAINDLLKMNGSHFVRCTPRQCSTPGRCIQQRALTPWFSHHPRPLPSSHGILQPITNHHPQPMGEVKRPSDSCLSARRTVSNPLIGVSAGRF